MEAAHCLKINAIFFSDIFWSEPNWVSYCVLSRLVHTLCSARMFCSAVFNSINLWHLMRRRFFAWPNSSEVLMNLLNSSVAHTLLGTVLLKLVKHTLCLEHLYSCLFQPLYTDKHAGDFLWTNPRVVWEYLYSDQWEPSNITRLIRVDQSQVLELTQIDKQHPAIQFLGPSLYFI